MRTPVILVAGQGDTDATTGALLHDPGTLVVEHRFDGHVVRRTTITLHDGVLTTSETGLELAHGCVSCTVRNDLLVLLRQLHRRDDVARIVVHLAPWLEPEPICWAINHVRVRVAHGDICGSAARDVDIAAVITCVDSAVWLSQALGDDDLEDGRTMAQVVVGQAEFADVVVLDEPESVTLAALRRLTPRARITVGWQRVEMALAHVDPHARRGRSDDPHAPLLYGEPPLNADGDVGIVEFQARRPFHPERLHAAVDTLLDGVIRTRGRLWLANRPDTSAWIESAGGGMRIASAGKWIAAMSPSEVAYVNPQRRVLADLMWEPGIGDRHTSIVTLVCGAHPADIDAALRGALLTDEEMAKPQGWAEYADPFGDWHEDPCVDLPEEASQASARGAAGGDQR